MNHIIGEAPTVADLHPIVCVGCWKALPKADAIKVHTLDLAEEHHVCSPACRARWLDMLQDLQERRERAVAFHDPVEVFTPLSGLAQLYFARHGKPWSIHGPS